MDGALADPPNEVSLPGGASQRSNRPVRASAPQLRAGATRHGQDIMTFFGGKSVRAARSAACRLIHSIDRGRTARATAAPTEGCGPRCGRSPDCPPRGWRAGRPELGALPTPRCVQPDRGAPIPAARWGSAGSLCRVRAIPRSLAAAFSVSPCTQDMSPRVGPELTGQCTSDADEVPGECSVRFSRLTALGFVLPHRSVRGQSSFSFARGNVSGCVNEEKAV